MLKTLLALACGGLMVAATAVAQGDNPDGTGHDAKAHHDFKDAEKWARSFESKDRRAWQKPQIVVRVLGLIDGDVVADLGAGTGYFTQVLSQSVGTTGKVYAVDVEPDMIEYIDARTDLGPGPVETILAQPDDPGLPERSVDIVLVVNTWHHIDDRLRYLERIRGSLGDGGRAAIIDWHAGDLPVGPPPGSKLSREEVIAEFEEAGWRVGLESVALPYQYFLVFYPPS